MSDEDDSQDSTDHPFEAAIGGATDDETDSDPLSAGSIDEPSVDDDPDSDEPTSESDDRETEDTADDRETADESGMDELDGQEMAGVTTRTDDEDDRVADLEKWEDRLDQREEGLDLRAEKLKDRAAELDDREAELETERQDLDDWRGDLEERQARLDQREQDLDEREASIHERETELAERAAELEETEQTLHEYVGNNLGDVETRITDTVREAVATAAERIEPGEATVDQESLDQTVESAIDDAMRSRTRGRFGTAGNVLIGLVGLAFVLGGATVLFSTQTDAIPRAFTGASLNYGVAAVLVFVGLVLNLSTVADRI